MGEVLLAKCPLLAQSGHPLIRSTAFHFRTRNIRYWPKEDMGSGVGPQSNRLKLEVEFIVRLIFIALKFRDLSPNRLRGDSDEIRTKNRLYQTDDARFIARSFSL